jgi:hydroxymethylpyrimidine pyrophosphatase-like HAD family hydrolase
MVQRSTINGISIEAIPVNELRYAFAQIENDLQYIRTKSFSDWIVSDIYLALRNEQSTLYMFYKDDEYIGFIITSLISDPGGELTLFVWATYQKPEYNYRQVGFDFLDKLALDKKVKTIEFHTSRQGWERVAGKHGFELTSYVYRKEV